MHRFLLALPLCLIATAARGDDVVKKVEAVFEPAEAKPGQAVTLKITVKLADGFHTYPLIQSSPEARYSVNAMKFPDGGPIVFVDKTVDPPSPKTKKGEDHEYLIYPGGGTWTRKAVVLPSIKAGPATVKVKAKLLVCDEDRCLPPKTYDLEATLKVLDGPAVAVEAKYKAEVEKAGKR
jgi:DsbC/DsbD-like thiol-disulfide interchange protein